MNSGRRIRWRHWACVSTALLLSACGGGGGTSGTATVPTAQINASSSSARPVTQSDVEIATLIYSDQQRTPLSFYNDAAPTFNGYVATSHIKNTDLDGSASTQHELCTDDFNQALQWSEAANTNGVNGASANLVGNSATDRYFEFDRVRNSTPQGYLRDRIFKCAYLNRDNVDLNQPQGAAGLLNVRPLTAATLRDLSEYLWQFTTYNNYGHVVLSSEGTANITSLSHSLFIASLTTSGAANSCDTIDVAEWKHSLNTANGALVLSVVPLWSFQAQYSNGAVTLCP